MQNTFIHQKNKIKNETRLPLAEQEEIKQSFFITQDEDWGFKALQRPVSEQMKVSAALRRWKIPQGYLVFFFFVEKSMRKPQKMEGDHKCKLHIHLFSWTHFVRSTLLPNGTPFAGGSRSTQVNTADQPVWFLRTVTDLIWWLYRPFL